MRLPRFLQAMQTPGSNALNGRNHSTLATMTTAVHVGNQCRVSFLKHQVFSGSPLSPILHHNHKISLVKFCLVQNGKTMQAKQLYRPKRWATETVTIIRTRYLYYSKEWDFLRIRLEKPILVGKYHFLYCKLVHSQSFVNYQSGRVGKLRWCPFQRALIGNLQMSRTVRFYCAKSLNRCHLHGPTGR